MSSCVFCKYDVDGTLKIYDYYICTDCFLSYKMLSEYDETKEFKTDAEFTEYEVNLSKEYDAKQRAVKVKYRVFMENKDHCEHWCPCCDGHYGCCCEKDGCERCYNCQCSYCKKESDSDISDEQESKDDFFNIAATSAETKVKFKKVLEQLRLKMNNDTIEDTYCNVQ